MDTPEPEGAPKAGGESGDAAPGHLDWPPVALALEVSFRVANTSGSLVVPSRLTYDPSDPLVVHLYLCPVGAAFIEWIIGRDLLLDGMSAPAGEGFVSAWTGGAHGRRLLFLSLTSTDGHALLFTGADEISTFLARSEELVPRDHEAPHLDLDGLIARLLGTT